MMNIVNEINKNNKSIDQSMKCSVERARGNNLQFKGMFNEALIVSR